MKSDMNFFVELAALFLPFILFAFLNSAANVKKEIRCRQYTMPLFAIVYCVLLMLCQDQLVALCMEKFLQLTDMLEQTGLEMVSEYIRNLYASRRVFLELVLFNTAALILYVIVKQTLTAIMGCFKVRRDSLSGSIVDLFYAYDEQDDSWYIKAHYGQARSFIKTAYYGCCFVSAIALLISCGLYMDYQVSAPFYPVFAIIIIGEMAFFVDGMEKEDRKSDISVQADKSSHIAMYPLLRRPLRALFGDKLSAEGTTVNNSGVVGGAIEDILAGLERDGGHIGKNYAAFIRKKMESGLKPNVDYVRCGYDLATGKSLLFNTPFYDKLNPYVFYAMNRELLTGGKALIVLGRHGTEEDLQQWTRTGMQAASNIPDLWKIKVLTGKKVNENELPDIGIISRSGVHDLDIHKNSKLFLNKVSFVLVVEPSRLVTTAQIGLNLLIKCCGKERAITFCSVDRNCDGLVDALSHILMTNITEVSATEYPHGTSSYMYWTVDDEYLQHRILPGVSRCLGVGTELSLVALKNQVKKTVWYGGEAYPVLDARWIAKQYYYDLLNYAELPTNQETFDRCFHTSFNMSDERVSDYSFITVEDDRNNLFETRRNFATIAEQQGFVNVLSSEYMLREYMAENPELFTADAKAIPYITADYARTKRNAILSLCLLLCIDSVQEKVLDRQMAMLNIETKYPAAEIWKEVCVIFGDEAVTDKEGTPILSVKTRDGRTRRFERDKTILFKREYSVDTGKFESVYTIGDVEFSRIILDALQSASYIAEEENKDEYLGSELKGHVYQKYMPGQLFTLNGKYYEMVSAATENRIMVRRASEHIGGRLAYRQVRNYTIHHLEDSEFMGALKSVNNIDVHYQYADFSVETPGYWKLKAHNDFDDGVLVKVNGVPVREYHHKQILKLDFSKVAEEFTDSVRMTLTNILNEVFVTLFAENQAFISAVTPGSYTAPLTYSLAVDEEIENVDKCIFIIEDSQLDIGLLVAVERNIGRIMQIVSDYLTWNAEQIAESMRKQNTPVQEKEIEAFDAFEETGEPVKKKNIFGRLLDKLKALFRKIFKKSGTEGEDKRAARQRKKEEKAAKRAAAKEERKAAREKKKAEKQAEKLRKEQEKAAKQAEKELSDKEEAVTAEEAAEVVVPAELPADSEQQGELHEAETPAEGDVPAEDETPSEEESPADGESSEESVDSASDEAPAEDEPATENEEALEQDCTEGEVSDNV